MSVPNFNTIDEIITDFRRGQQVIIVDDEGRENEGDLFIAAEKITPQVVNFMRRFGSGVICLALSTEKCEALSLEMMVDHNTAKLQTPFTVSIDAKVGITTGISAKDRARTLQLAAPSKASAKDFVKPGHIFPLKAHPKGVLGRNGHTEAAVDLAKLAGLSPAVALVELVNEDGSMAKGEALWAFAKAHHLKIGTIEALIAYQKNNASTNAFAMAG